MSFNDPQGGILYCRYGKGYRFTLNPKSRRQEGAAWNAGPVTDWCEVPDTAALEAAVLKAIKVTPADTRLGRQQQAHKLGLCTRRGGHWSREEKD